MSFSIRVIKAWKGGIWQHWLAQRHCATISVHQVQFLEYYICWMFIHTHLLTWLTFAPWVARKSAAASLPALAALCIRQFSTRNETRRDEDEYMFKGTSIIPVKKNYCEETIWNGTCARVGGIGVASSLNELGRKTILIKRSAVYYWCIIFKWVDWEVWRQGDVLQSQPQRCAALVVLEFQVKSK